MTDQHDTNAVILRQIAERIALGLAHAETSQPQSPPAAPSITPAVQHLAKLAHELKTPLSAIIAAAEIMRDERFGPIGDPRYRDYASGIYESAYHALGVINAMLGNQSTAGLPLQTATFTELDLNAVAIQTQASLLALMEAAGLSIDHKLQAGLPHVIADPLTVRQMLLNLATNAMRATPSGGTILIETSYDLTGPVHLTVTDTGSGMSQDDIARALDPARQADFQPRASGGLGLGYPLILQLAAMNGANVAIVSEAGHGTAVDITFPPSRIIPI